LIEKLELLLALAKERHFGRAAEACGVTQPTMSTSLKQLEEILGVMLVQRGSRFRGFTPEGERTLDWARRIVGDTRAMRQGDQEPQALPFRRTEDRGDPDRARQVAQLTTPFRALSRCSLPHPVLRRRKCSVCWRTSKSMRDSLHRERADRQCVRTIPLYNESYRLLTARDAMFGDRDQVTWKEVGQVPLCLLTPTCRTAASSIAP
jgi:DNA-binding transcriptional LysR family regulator